MFNDSFLFKGRDRKLVRAKVTQTTIIGVKNLLLEESASPAVTDHSDFFRPESEGISPVTVIESPVLNESPVLQRSAPKRPAQLEFTDSSIQRLTVEP